MFYIYLSLGGMAGTLARYGVGEWIDSWAGWAFPWGTLTVNLVGSFILGFVIRAAEVLPLSLIAVAPITIGFCGALTTFSTFSYETISLLQDGAWPRAILYVAGSLVLGLVAVVLGLGSASLILTRTT